MENEPFDMGVSQELARSEHYINRDVYPDHRLYKLLMHWKLEEENSLRSPRSREQVATLCGRIAFELVSREKEQLRNEYGG